MATIWLKSVHSAMSRDRLDSANPLTCLLEFDPKWAIGQDHKIDLKSKFDPKLVA